MFRRPGPDSAAEKLFELSDQLARTVGTILDGAYFQPIRTGTIETVLDDDSLIEWMKVTEDSPIADVTLGDCGVRQRTGTSVIAIQRGDETIPNPAPDLVIRPGDVLVPLDDREDHRLRRDLVEP